MASAQVEEQTAQAGPEQAENQHQQLCHDALHEEELCEPAVQIQVTPKAPLNENEASRLTSESGVVEQPAAENQEQSTGRKEQEGEGSKSAESAQLRARRLAVEAAEAQEAAQQAAKLAAEKQLKAYEAAKEARDAIHAEHEAAKAAARHDVEVMAERACKQQKLCAESSHETLRQLVHTTAEESLRQAVEEKGNGPNQSSQSSSGAEAVKDGARKSIPRQLAAGATETVQHMMETTINKDAADLFSSKDGHEGSQNMEQDKNPARESELPTGPETPTRPGPQMGAQALEGVPIQPPASVNGIQVHPLDPNAITQNPFVLPANVGPDSVRNSGPDFLGTAPDGDTYRTVPENQSTEQAPSPMQVG